MRVNEPTAVLCLPNGTTRIYGVEQVLDSNGTVVALLQRKQELMEELNTMIASGEHGSDQELPNEGCYGEEVLSEDDEINEEVQRSSVVSSRKKAKKA